ncbi:MAG: iron-regulated protein [Colwellia sp.]|nr:iron-regulated protein [Colwellia sp.]
MNKILLNGFALFALASLAACDGDPDNFNTVDYIADNHVDIAYAAYSDSKTAALALQQSVNTFISTPTEGNLLLAKAAYKAIRAPYQQSEIMRFDSVITVGQNLDVDGGPASVDEWEGQVNAWPLDENHIVTIIAGSEVINIALLLSQNGADDNDANVTTGIHAVEFMLWGSDLNGTEAGAGERPATDFANDGTCADSYCEQRAQYLSAAIDLLVNDLTTMTDEWSPAAKTTAGTLAYNFLNSSLAIDYMVGSMITMATDELASARMGSGLTLGDPEEEHDCFSDLSHLAIYHNFQGVKNTFYGTYQSEAYNISGASLAVLVNSKSAGTFDTIDAALTSIEAKMLQILEAGEREINPVKFDQIIGQPSNGVERLIAESVVTELIALDTELELMAEVLALENIDSEFGGD